MSYFFDVCVNLISTFLVFIISWLFYKLLAKNPLLSYFSKNKPSVNRHYYKLSCSPDGKDHFDTFLSNGYVAIAWPKIGDLTNLIGKSENEIRKTIREKLELKYPMKNTTTGQVAGYFYKLLSMKPKDILVLPGKNELYICQVTKGYSYSESEDSTSHRIKIDTKNGIKIPLDGTKNITPRFKKAAQNRLTLISLDDYSAQIEELIN